MITIEDIKNSSQIRTYIQKADETMCALGYTEHSFAHVTRVSETARQILLGVWMWTAGPDRSLPAKTPAFWLIETKQRGHGPSLFSLPL